MEGIMKRTIVGLLAVIVTAAAASPVAASGLELRVGRFFPRADSSLFHDNTELYMYDGGDLQRSDWDGWTGGIEWNMAVASKVELGIHLDGYARTLHTSSRDFTFDSGREILQSLALDIVPLGFSVRFLPAGPRASVVPYIGVGGDVVFWQYEEYGEFVDYESYDPADDSFAVYEDAFLAEGTTVGVHVLGGVRFPISDDLSLVAEGRYLWAEADMGEDFRGLRIDLSGASATLGLRLKF
jgi:opacity protein-like surface antigen